MLIPLKPEVEKVGDLAHEARRRLWIASPYLVPDPAISAALQVAARAGADGIALSFVALAALCTVTISRFYRDRAIFDQLASTVLPELAQAAVARGAARLECWSAGCAGGAREQRPAHRPEVDEPRPAVGRGRDEARREDHRERGRDRLDRRDGNGSP